jgi:hypothetical protein
MVEESVRKTAAKKTVRKAVGRTAAVKRAPRTRKVAGEEIESAPATRPRRKAPTAVAANIESAAKSSKLMYVGIGAFVLLFVIGTGIGLTDRGAINVKAIIETRISAASPEERARLEQAQSASSNLVDGGLVASDVPDVPAVPAATSTATSTAATSTEATATSTPVSDTSTEAVVPETSEETPSPDGLVPTDTPAL